MTGYLHMYSINLTVSLHLAKVIISILTRLFFNSVRIKIEISTTKISLCPVALQGSTLKKEKKKLKGDEDEKSKEEEL